MRKRLAEGVKALKATAQKAAVNVKAQYADHQTEKAHRILQQEIDQLQAYSDTIPILKDQLNPLTLLKTLLNTDMLLVWSDKLETDGPTWKESFSNRIKYLNERKQSDNPHNLEKEPAEIQIAKDTLSQISTSYNTAVGERKKAIIKVKQRLAEIVKLKLLASDENLSQLKGLANTLLAYNPELKTSMDSFANLALLKSFEMDSDHPLSTINDSLKKSLPNISDLENQVKHAKVERFKKAFELERNAKKITTRISCSIHDAARQVITHYLNGHINTNYQSCLGVLKHRARLTPIEAIHNKTTGLLAFAAYEGEGKAYYPERLQQAERKAAEKAAAGAERTAEKNRETKENITAKKEELTSSRREIIKYEKNLGLNSEILINDASNSGSATTSLDDQLRSLMLNIDSAAAALARLAKQQEEMQKALDKTHSAINRLNEPEQDQPIEGTLFDKLCDQSKKLIAICETKCQLTFIEPADDSIAGNIVDYSIPAPTAENSFNLKSTLSISEHLIKPETLDLLTARASNSGTYHDIEIPINLLYELSSAITEAEAAAETQRQAAAETQRQAEAAAETQRQVAAAETQRQVAAAETQRQTAAAETQRQVAAAETQRQTAAAAAETQRQVAAAAAAETQRQVAGTPNQRQGGTNSHNTTRSSFSEKWKNLHWGWKVVAAIAIIVGIAAIAFGAHFLMAAVVITKAVICIGGGSILGGALLTTGTAYAHFKHINSKNKQSTAAQPKADSGIPQTCIREQFTIIANNYSKKSYKIFRSKSRAVMLQLLYAAATDIAIDDVKALLILQMIVSAITAEQPRKASKLEAAVAPAIVDNMGLQNQAIVTTESVRTLQKLTLFTQNKALNNFITENSPKPPTARTTLEG